MAASSFETVLRAFRVFNSFDGPASDELWWRTGDEYAPVTLLVRCDDLFFWACSDCEELNDANIAELERAYEDCKALGDFGDEAAKLFCSRVRRLRPQGACYKYIAKELHHLFDECGEPRGTGLMNPCEQTANPPPLTLEP